MRRIRAFEKESHEQCSWSEGILFDSLGLKVLILFERECHGGEAI